MKIFLGISGASGVNLGLKLAFEIAKRAQLHLCVSKNAMNVLEKELNFTDFFRKNGENLNIIGVMSGKFDEATAKFSNAARGGEVLNFRTDQNAVKFDKIYGDENDADADFQISAPNLKRANKNDSQKRYGEGAKFANLSFAQSEADFGDSDKKSKSKNGEFVSNGTQIFSDENLKNCKTIGSVGSRDNGDLDDANDQICRNSGKFYGGYDDKIKEQDGKICGKIDAIKSQNKDNFDKIYVKNDKYSDKFDTRFNEKNKAGISREYSAVKSQNQVDFDKFNACFNDKNKFENLSDFNTVKSQDKDNFDKFLSQSGAKQDEIYQIWQDLQNRAVIYGDSDLAAAPSSGSFGTHAAIVAPCSINTLAKIHAGFADTLITRAAAVALKERKRLVLGVREMPFSTLALEHAAKLSALGAVIAPPVLGYYSAQNSLEDMENFIIGKWLDLLGLKHQIYKRWS